MPRPVLGRDVGFQASINPVVLCIPRLATRQTDTATPVSRAPALPPAKPRTWRFNPGNFLGCWRRRRYGVIL